MTKQTCKDCRFWVPEAWWSERRSDAEPTDHPRLGECRRYAPPPKHLPPPDVRYEVLGDCKPRSPGICPSLTAPDYWCGEFKPRPKPADPEPQEETVSEVDFSALKPWKRFCEMFAATRHFIYRAAEAWSDLDGSSLTWFENLGWEKFTKLLADGPGDLRSREWINRRLLMIHRIGPSKAQMVMDHMAACGWPFRE